MKKIHIIYIAVLISLIASCKKDEVTPTTLILKKDCRCIMDTCYVTLDQMVNKKYPADSCKNIVITDIANYVPKYDMY